MSTPQTRKKPALIDDVIFKGLSKVIAYQPKGEDDKIGLKRSSFLTDLTELLSDKSILTLHGITPTPKRESNLAGALRDDVDVEVVSGKLAEELIDTSGEKMSGTLSEILQLIAEHDELKGRLLEVLKAPKEVLIDVTKPERPVVLENAMAKSNKPPDRVFIGNPASKSVNYYWAIRQVGNVLVLIPTGHPDVKHLELLYGQKIPITMQNVYPLHPSQLKTATVLNGPKQESPTSAERNLISLLSDDDDATNSPVIGTRGRKRPKIEIDEDLKQEMLKNRDDTVRRIIPRIKTRMKLLLRNLPSLSEPQAKLRALAWAKHWINAHNRFSPKGYSDPKTLKHDVIDMILEALFGPKEYDLSNEDLVQVEHYFNSYMKKEAGYAQDESDGLS